MAQFHASKLAAHKATLDIAHEHRPAYEIVTIHPVFVFGRSLIQESADDLAGSPGLLFKSLMSEKPPVGGFRGVHVDDVAEAHVRALRTGITGLRSYLFAGEICSWVEVNRFARERYPLVPFQLKPEDDTDTGGYRADASRAEAELGIRFKGMEEQVADVEQQLDFRGTF
jgi:nucleoside-diphosphate-sugar epimerase